MVKDYRCRACISCTKGGCEKVDNNVLADVCLNCKDSVVILDLVIKKKKEEREIEKKKIKTNVLEL